MKILPVFLPATAPPAMNRFGTLLSNVSGLSVGASVSGSTLDPCSPHQINVRVVTRQQENCLSRNRLLRALPFDDHLGGPNLYDA